MYGRPSRMRQRVEGGACSVIRRGAAGADVWRSGRRVSMARKLETYQTSLGFFDQAIAAPSMKAALEAWGADSNLFHQGAAKESHDPEIIAATLAKPGVVLRRPVGTDRPFREHAGCPLISPAENQQRRPPSRKAERRRKIPLAPSTRPRNGRPLSPTSGNRRAARQKDHARRQQAVDKAQAALKRAEQEHAKRAAAIEAKVEALEKRSQAEKARWDKEKERLEAALRARAGRGTHS